MALEKLVVVRHGDNEESSPYNLTDWGRRQIELLAEILIERFKGKKICLLSSNASRATESARILGEYLGVKFETFDFLQSGGGSLKQDQIDQTLELIDQKTEEYEVIILSSHLEYAEEFPYFWGKAKNLKVRFVEEPRKGSARIVDVSNGSDEYVVGW